MRTCCLVFRSVGFTISHKVSGLIPRPSSALCPWARHLITHLIQSTQIKMSNSHTRAALSPFLSPVITTLMFHRSKNGDGWKSVPIYSQLLQAPKTISWSQALDTTKLSLFVIGSYEIPLFVHFIKLLKKIPKIKHKMKI